MRLSENNVSPQLHARTVLAVWPDLIETFLLGETTCTIKMIELFSIDK